MESQRIFDEPLPSPDEIRAAVRRAHDERSQALSRMLAALFARRNASVARPERTAGTAACR